jgi:hypothetical protein
MLTDAIVDNEPKWRVDEILRYKMGTGRSQRMGGYITPETRMSVFVQLLHAADAAWIHFLVPYFIITLPTDLCGSQKMAIAWASFKKADIDLHQVVTSEECPENKHTVEPVAVGGRMADINIPIQVDVEPSSENSETRVSIKSPYMVVLLGAWGCLSRAWSHQRYP